jgi:hypothetical protein
VIEYVLIGVAFLIFLGVVGVVALLGLVRLMRGKRPAPAPRPAQPTFFSPRPEAPAAPVQPGSILGAYDVAGRPTTERIIDEALGQFRAKRIAQELSEALNVIDRPMSAAAPTAPKAE